MDLKRLAREINPTLSEHVLPISDEWVNIPELDQRICNINQLTRQQHASLMDEHRFQVYSFMANYPSALEASLDHRPSQRQPAEEESSSSDHAIADPSGAEQDTSFEVRNSLAGTCRPAEPSKGG